MRKKGWKKRVASAVLAAAMVVSQIGVWNLGMGVEAVKAEEINYITNGDFEGTDLSNWTFDVKDQMGISYGIVSGYDGVANTGHWLEIKNENTWDATERATNSYEVKLTQTIAEISAGTYTLSYSVGNWGTSSIGIITDNSIMSDWQGHSVSEWSEFKTYTRTITVEQDVTDYVVGFDFWINNGSQLYFEDISLVSLVEDNDGDTGAKNLFTGLDANLTGWICSNGSASFTNDNIVLTADNASGAQVNFYQAIPTENGKEYTAQVISKTESTNVWVNSYINEKCNDYIQATTTGAALTFKFTGNGDDMNIGVSVWIPGGDSCTIETLLLTKEPDEEVDASEAVAAGIKIDKISNLPEDFIKGVDVSSYISEKNSGVKYYDFEGNELDDQGFFNLLASCGVNYVRIRVWNNPYDANGNGYGGGTNDVAKAKQIGKWATDAGMKVLIDFHYSDFWTDPGKQYVPKQWTGYSVAQKAEAISEFTQNSLTEIIEAGVNVGMVQVGNETNAYFCGEKDWSNICTLFKAGCSAVRTVEDDTYGSEIVDGSKIMIALHFADPQAAGTYAAYAKNLNDYSVDYDVFASSYYPFFHGTTTNLTAVLKNIADTYGKKVMVAETSWATTLDDGDGHDNQIRVGTNDTPHYEFSVLGQATEIRTVMKAVVDAGDAGIGVFYWEPAWIPVQYAYDSDGNLNQNIRNSNVSKWERYGSGWAASYAGDYQVDAATWYGGSAMDNQAMFDMYGHPLESLKVFNYVSTGTYISQKAITSATVDAIELTEGDSIADNLGQAKVGFNDGTTQKADVVWSSTDIAKAQAGGAGEYVIRGTVSVTVDETVLSKDVTCQVTILPYNYMPNYSLEESSAWICNGSVGVKADGNSRTGSNALKFYSENEFDYDASITVDNLKSGVYKFGGYLQGGDVGDNATFTYCIQVGNGEPITVTADALIGWKNWRDTSISKVTIPQDNTQVTITVKGTDIAAGGWGSWDDFYIIEGEKESSGSTPTPSIPSNPTPSTPDDSASEIPGSTVTVNPDGTVTETTVIDDIAKNTEASVSVKKNEVGEIISATAEVSKLGTSNKNGVTATLSANVISKITEAAGTSSVDITMTVTAGKKVYTITAAAEDIEAGNKLKVYAINPETGKYVLVNAKTYTVSKTGNVKVTLPAGADYQLLDTKAASKVEKQILATVKVTKSSATVKTGKSMTVMSSKLDMNNVSKIVFTTSKKSVATVSKNGKVKAKKAGTATVKAQVTLKNGKTKTVTMKIKVK